MWAGELRQLRYLFGSRAWLLESCGSCLWRSEELMTLMTDRSELNVITDHCELWAPPLYYACWAELKLAVAIVSADWLVHVMIYRWAEYRMLYKYE